MANLVASVSPSAPIIAIYIHEMVRMLALPRRGRNRPMGFSPPRLMTLWPGRNSTPCSDANRPDARSAAAVRNAKRFVQIQMANVRADEAGAGEADLCVHVRAVHVNPPPPFVDDFANFADGFEHAVRGRIGDHQARDRPTVRLGFRALRSATSMLPLVSHATATTFITRQTATALAGSVPCAGGNETDVAMASPRDS